MTKTITIHIRPFRWYREEPCESFGFSGRAAYALGFDKPNYPVPAIRTMADNAQRLITFGEITAENGFDIATVFERFVKL